MDRRALLKNACGVGMCSCFLTGLLASTQAHAETDTEEKKPQAPPDWRLGFVKKRYTALMAILYEQLGPEGFSVMIQKMGGDCSKSIQMITDCKGDPDKYFDIMKQRWQEDIRYDKEKGVVTIVGPERKECFCPLIDTQKTPAYVCDCSIGWQKQTYKTIFGKDVDVVLQESVLRGGKRCAFNVTIKD